MRGNLKFGSVTEIDGTAVPGGKLRGCAFGSGLNGVVQPGALHWSAIVSMPVPPYPLEIQTYGARPWKTPMPPRNCCFPLPDGSQLKPRRGSHVTLVCGLADVDRPS